LLRKHQLGGSLATLKKKNFQSKSITLDDHKSPKESLQGRNVRTARSQFPADQDKTIGTHTAKEEKEKRKRQEEGGSQCKNERKPFGDGAG
jgi:hypothetical protein